MAGRAAPLARCTAGENHHISGGDIRIAGTEPDQEIRCIAIQPARERPLRHHDAYHAGLGDDLVSNVSFVQVHDVGLGKSHDYCYAITWEVGMVPGLIVLGAVKKRKPS